MDSSQIISSVLTSEKLHEKRIDALNEVDNASFGLFHVKLCIVAGIGFFTVAYDIFAIGIASTILGTIYGASGSDSRNPLRHLNSNQDLGIKIVTLVGTLVGQLIFGWLADHTKTLLDLLDADGFELILIIFTTFAQAIAGNGPAPLYRSIKADNTSRVGIGVGGDHPISAVIASELAVFSARGWGQLAASIVAIVVTAAFKDSVITNPVTGLCMADSDRCGVHSRYIERNIQQAARDIENAFSPKEPANPTYNSNPVAEVGVGSWKDFKAHFRQWKNMKILIGTAYSWFALEKPPPGLKMVGPRLRATVSAACLSEIARTHQV
ncbi:hypothetical protein GYMLUDRAFT_262105 [Collybiopsis luxurians FD-317 M1]|uniref:Uncharacterized protein n=1 Tax=Collybiopsis luxurians FD-317 M1 TaxID=944289 RepID=A0A0D0CA56_9AGAR|nr:hypothetical protein GYMLUDRAFT_262105 [Collybiopsis luxurians FD-317 M1]